MSMGIGILLAVIGAILTFAVHTTISGIDLALIGEILMVAGGVVFLISLFLTLSRRRSVSTSRVGVDAAGNQVASKETVSGGPTQI